MKRIISVCLIVSMLMSLAPIGALAGMNSIDFITTDSFNSQATGELPSLAQTEGEPRIAVVEEGKEKAVELSDNSNTNKIYYPIESSSDTLSFYTEIKVTGQFSDINLYINDETGKSYSVAKITADGRVCTVDDRAASGFAKGIFIPFQLTYNKSQKRVSICVNEKEIVSDRQINSAMPFEVKGFGMSCTGKSGSSILADNIAIFEGDAICKKGSVPKSAYSTSSSGSGGVAFTPREAEASTPGTTVYLSRTFDEPNMDPLDCVTFDVGKNTGYAETDIVTDNTYIRLDKTTKEKCMIQLGGNSASKYIVAQMDFSVANGTVRGSLIYGRDERAKQMFYDYVSLTANGEITAGYGGEVIGKVEKGRWTNVAAAIDFNELTYDIYINGKLKAENVSIEEKTTTALPNVLAGFIAIAGNADLLIDNVKVYDGTEPREINYTVKRNVATPDNIPVDYLGANKAISYANNTIYDGSKKTYTQNPIINKDGVLYLSEADLKTVFGEETVCTGESKDEAGYYSADATAASLGYKKQEYESRVAVYTLSLPSYTEDKLNAIHKYMLYDRPTAQKLLDSFKQMNAGHPRILINSDDVARIKELYKTDEIMKKWGEDVIKMADDTLTKEPYSYYSSGLNLNHIDEGRLRVKNLGMAYFLTNDMKYVNRAWAELERIALLDSWNPQSYLDVAELMAILSIGYDWLYDVLTPEQRSFMEDTIYTRGLHLSKRNYYNQLTAEEKAANYSTGWYGALNNWNSVTNGGTMMAAMALMDVYPDECADVISIAIRCLELMLMLYYPNGDWEEGTAYWRYALEYVVYSSLSLEKTFGSDFGISKTPGLSRTGWYGIDLSGSTGFFTAGDSGTAFENNRHVMWCATKYGDSELVMARLNEMEKLGYEGTALDMIYYNPELVTSKVTDLPLDTKTRGTETYSFREKWYDSKSTYLGFAGGDNNRNHGHLDIGNFVVDMDGVRIIRDSGVEDYGMKGYFSDLRYHYYRARTEGHNLYVINPINNINHLGAELEATALGSKIVSKSRGAYATMDLSEAYRKYATSAVRGYMLTDNRDTIIVRDEIDLRSPSEVYWFLHTKGEIDIIDNNTVIFTADGVSAKVQIITNAGDYTIEAGDALPLDTSPQLSQTGPSGLKKLTLKLNAEGRLIVQVRITNLGEPASDKAIEDIDIKDWTIPDGEYEEYVYPKLDALYVDGKLIDDFDKEVSTYSVICLESAKEVPQISVSTSHRCEIEQAADFGDYASVRIYSDTDPEIYKNYRVKIAKMPPMKDVSGMKRYNVSNVTASEIPQPQNGPLNVVDQDFGTRYAAEGMGPYVTLELEEVNRVDSVAVSFMSGDARVYTYKIEISLDGVSWKEVFNGKSSGTTAGYNFTEVPGEMAKFVRVTGYQNSSNAWNSITEVAVLGNR